MNKNSDKSGGGFFDLHCI